MRPGFEGDTEVSVRLHGCRAWSGQVDLRNYRAGLDGEVKPVVGQRDEHVNLTLGEEAARAVGGPATKGGIALDLVQVLLLAEALRVEDERLGAEDVAVYEELPEWCDDFLARRHELSPNRGVDHRFAGHGCAVIDSEDLVPDGV